MKIQIWQNLYFKSKSSRKKIVRDFALTREHNSCYKLKEKVSLEFLWLSSNNCTNSFLLGWPTTRNYIAHFSTEREKSDWFEKLNSAIQRRLRPKSTTIGVFVQIEGRQQQIRREVKNGQRAEDLIEALRIELHLPVIDPHLGHYELCFCPGSRRNSGGGCHISSFLPSNNNNTTNNSSIETKLPPSPQLFGASENLINKKEENLNKKENLNNSSLSSSPAILRRVQSHTCIVSPLQAAHRSPVYNNCQYNSAAIQPLHGVENVYAVLMEFVRSQLGISLSDSQLAHLDTCPLVNCKLLLRQTGPSNSPSHASGHHNKRAALNLVNQFRRVVLGRTDSATSSGCNSPTANPPPFGIDPNSGKKLKMPNKKQRLFGRQLRGTMPHSLY
uniref:ARHGAP20 PH domain-containing protein n=1 Tax=Meloidogyne enterolobii TaxID=390850 RepID=A0A6V7VYP9_MELEN|nr:unnamed protein product [Meloidogyne enterolobii]